jgi:uncharacterized protein YjiS (DUF1127 family)
MILEGIDMTHIAIERRSGTADGAGRVAAWLSGAWRAWQNRMAARRLQQFDDRMLTDIGLTRADVEGAFSAPIWEDPSLQLHQKVMERRRARRRV